MIPCFVVLSSLEDDRQREYVAIAANGLNGSDLFLVAWLNKLWMAFNISSGNDSSSSNKAHGKVSLIEVVDIIVENAIFND